MAINRMIRISLVIVAASLAPSVAWSQTSSTGTATTTTGGSSTTISSSGTSRTRIKPDTSTQQQDLRQLSSLFITGMVIMDDGSRPPTGVVIERVCDGQVIRETYSDLEGGFSFQLGNRIISPDAGDGSNDGIWDPIGTMSMQAATGLNLARLTGCELRAQLGGYKSNILDLNIGQTMGNYQAGTFVLYPAAKIKGTTVSITSLAAPKKSKKAMEMAWKAIERKDFQSAETYLHAALAEYPNYAAAWSMLGDLSEMALHFGEARIAYEKAIEADPNYVTPHVELARIAAISHQWEDSSELAASALRLDPIDFPYAYYLDALSNYNLNRLDAAERSLCTLEYMDSRHKYPEAYILRANIFHQKSDGAEEADQLRAYLKYSPEAANASQIRARLERIGGE